MEHFQVCTRSNQSLIPQTLHSISTKYLQMCLVNAVIITFKSKPWSFRGAILRAEENQSSGGFSRAGEQQVCGR